MKGPIKRIEPGGDSLLMAEKANEVIDWLNALLTATVSPQGKVRAEKGGVVIDLSGGNPLQVILAINGTLQFVTLPVAIGNTSTQL